ncbi:hypothetical protein FLK61_33760 [Paenalkalicoccus suaedae]|uniref:Uncharacterized protein n=1 Tax=Paenalkalicoccus suaedae TaxID=2592382 RepID=A0A859FA28_9BACI|nr:hypothetical protein [Paenalkalicoccus suaedae]QKS69592.1 hypothetical protein FLK61_33760 [Paenalkalicoccus suaedae]
MHLYEAVTDSNGIVNVPFGQTFTSIINIQATPVKRSPNSPEMVFVSVIEQYATRCVLRASTGITGSLLGITTTLRSAASVNIYVLVIAR